MNDADKVSFTPCRHLTHYIYSGCSKSHQMISYESRCQLVFPLLIGKAQAPVQLRTNWKECAEIKETQRRRS